MKIDPTVKAETLYIGMVTLILSVLMEAVFLVLGYWDYTVILGNLLSAAAGVLNFFLMGLTVQSSVEKEEKEAKQQMKASQSLRNVGLLAVLALGVGLPVFNTVAVIVPLFFPRIAVQIRPLIHKKKEENS